MKNRVRSTLLLTALALLLGACASNTAPLREGFVDVPGGKVWYQIIGSGDKVPLLMLHGGPGGRGCGLTVLRDLGTDRPLVIYDQLGGGHTENPQDPSLWTVERFVDEVDAVRRALGLKSVHILGHSWGGTLAAEYLLTRKPEGVRSVILSSPLLSTERWIADARRLRSTLPPDIQRELERCENAGFPDEPSCSNATDVYNDRFLFGGKRLAPVPACKGVPSNDAIYRTMWGPTEFTATGALRDYDRTDRLGELQLPVLFIVGRYDEATPETTEEFRARVPGAKMAVLENSAHLGMRTETARFVEIVREFLESVEAGP
ncbi:MAG: proline iminopeptidase-family hydrolase [Thermoanaerobaculia bacterium]